MTVIFRIKGRINLYRRCSGTKSYYCRQGMFRASPIERGTLNEMRRNKWWLMIQRLVSYSFFPLTV